MRQVLFGILSVISANPGINQRSVGSVLGILKPNMVALVNDLVGRGWVAREADPADGRAFLLSLTDAGSAAAADTLARIRLHEARMLAGLSAEERRSLVRLLGRMARTARNGNDVAAAVGEGARGCVIE